MVSYHEEGLLPMTLRMISVGWSFQAVVLLRSVAILRSGHLQGGVGGMAHSGHFTQWSPAGVVWGMAHSGHFMLWSFHAVVTYTGWCVWQAQYDWLRRSETGMTTF